MNNELVIINDNKAITTSLIIAEVFEKKHKNIIQSIKNLDSDDLEEEEFNRLNFQPTSYIDPMGRKQIMYNITRDGFVLLVMSYIGKQARKWKIKYMRAFNDMEQRLTHNNYENIKTTFQDVSKQLKSIQLELFPRPESEINAFRSSKSTIAIKLPTEEKNTFKAECSLRNYTMRGFIRQCINNFIGQRKKLSEKEEVGAK